MKRRLFAITALVLTASACGSAPNSAANSASTEDQPAAPLVSEVPVVTEDAGAASDSEVAAAATPVIARILMPEPSGDPELDALGAELDGLEQELAALDAAADDALENP